MSIYVVILNILDPTSLQRESSTMLVEYQLLDVTTLRALTRIVIILVTSLSPISVYSQKILSTKYTLVYL